MAMTAELSTTEGLSTTAELSTTKGQGTHTDRTNGIRRNQDVGHIQAEERIEQSKPHAPRADRKELNSAVKSDVQSDSARRMRYQIQKAIRNPEKYSLHFIYVANNRVSIRAVNPYCWQGGDRFVGLCLSRQNHRCFRLDQIHKLSVVESSELTMPYPITELEVSGN